MIAALGLLAGAAAVADRTPALALVNESPSLPRGIYLRRPGADPARGAVVAIPQPPEARPYLASLGMPADVRLIKRVAAVGGDEVCADAGGVRTPVRRVRALPRDRRGAPLTAWTGCRRLAEAELFLLGDTAGSFDSRYFGPVARSGVDGVYREILTW
ncbi:MAG: S26 family signal peptidase [Caulobacterales bacterium]|nr:S26 family signal peptidase [Caulobacterales bacterium]